MHQKNTLSLNTTVGLDKNKLISIEELKRVPDSFFEEFYITNYLEYVENPAAVLELVAKKIRKGGSISIFAMETTEFCLNILGIMNDNIKLASEEIKNIKSIVELKTVQSFFEEKGFNIKFAEYSDYSFLLKVEKR